MAPYDSAHIEGKGPMRKYLVLLGSILFTVSACSGGDGKATSTSSGSGSSSSGSAGSGGDGGAGGAGGGGMAGGGGSAGMGGGGGGSAAESVVLRAQPCDKQPGSATKCESYEVTCGGADPAIVDVAYFEPVGGATKGAIIFGSGGDGTGYYNFTQRKALTDAGFTVVDRRWLAGWFTGAKDGPQQAACRYAALARYVKTNVVKDKLLCATGNSGGSAELGYALTWQGVGKVLDFALPSSGPFHRLDYACNGAADAMWTAECTALKTSTCPDCLSTGCQLGNGPRGLIDLSFGGTTRCSAPMGTDMATLKAASPELGPNVPMLDGAPVHFLVGKLDPGAYEPLVTSLFNTLSAKNANVKLTYVAGAAHEMDQSVEGGTAIRDTLLAECVP